MAGDMGPPPARTSFKRDAPDDEQDTTLLTTSKRAKPSTSSTEASTSSSGERPKRYTPDGREIPYITPRPGGSWRMITGEDIAYSPQERPTRAPRPKVKPEPSSQPSINQSFGQSTSSGIPREPRKRKDIVLPPTSSSSARLTSRVRSNPSSQNSSMASSSQPSQGVSRSQPEPSRNESQQLRQSSATGSSTTTINVVESIGDIFTAPPNTLIIHACNTEGSWGAGIAAAFKAKYPSAFEVYRDHCRLNGGELVGKAFLIPPQDDEKHFIGCLFTSLSKGRKVDSPAKILNATGPAIKDLIRQVKEYNSSHSDSPVGEVRMCKINSGLFNVKWEKTKEVLLSIEAEDGGIRQIKVISRSEED